MDITPTMLRTLGGLFELAGLATVAIGISDLRRRFSDRPPFIGAARATLSKAWDRLRGRREGQTITLGTAGEVSVAGSLGVKKMPTGGMTPEKKMDWLLRMVDELQERDTELSRKIDREKQKRAQELAAERTAREDAIGEVAGDIRTLATGDLTRQFWGVIAFGFGIILQVWSPEIAQLM